MKTPSKQQAVMAALVALSLAGCSKKAADPVEQIIVRKPGEAQVAAPAASAGDPIAAGRQAFAASCGACHAVTATGGPAIGPSLLGVFGRKAGSQPGFTYSAAMKASGITWDAGKIDALIANPAGLVPGTAMSAGAVSDARTRQAIIQYLKTLGAKE